VLHDGVLLIRRQLAQLLENKYGLKRLESLGKPFDPNSHEAVAMEQGEVGAATEPIVSEEFLPGYGLHERIIRTAKVKVRMPAQTPLGSEVKNSAGSPSENGGKPATEAADKGAAPASAGTNN
jgi:molecular chaperone GrpE